MSRSRAAAAAPVAGESPTSHPRVDAFAIARAAALLACGAVWIAFQSATRIRLEDALITFRYAENLARGLGYAYNPGEAVLGATSPLYTILLAAAGRGFGVEAIPIAALALGVLAGLVALWCLDAALAAAGLGKPWRIAAVLVAGLHPEILWATTGGMETPLVLALMAASLACAARDRWHAAAVLAALGVLARPDFAVWAALLLAIAAWRRRARVVVPVLAGAAVLAPWLGFATLTFGSPVPHSVTAKRVIQGPVTPDYLRWALESLWLPSAADRMPLEIATWLALAAIGAGAILARPRLRALLPVAAFVAAFPLALALGGAPKFPWYTVPVTWCAAVLGVVGAATLAGDGRVAAGARARRGVGLGFALALAALALEATAIARWGAEAVRHQTAHQQNEDGLRRRAGEWLRANTPEDAVVAMEAIGYQGLYSRRRVLDLGGLVSPEVVAAHREARSNAEAFALILDRRRPDAIVLRSMEVDGNQHFQGGPLFETAAQKSRFDAAYEEAIRLEAPRLDAWGVFGRLTLYRRRPGT